MWVFWILARVVFGNINDDTNVLLRINAVINADLMKTVFLNVIFFNAVKQTSNKIPTQLLLGERQTFQVYISNTRGMFEKYSIFFP